VKQTARGESLTFDITTRRARSFNLVLETRDKEHADDLAAALKRRFGETREIRHPLPSVALLLISIEDSVDESEPGSILEAHNPGLKTLNDVKIRKGSNGTRTAIIRVLSCRTSI